MKKVIEQEEAPNIIVIHKEDEIIVRENVLMQEPVTVEKSKAREVALAICPELGEPTIKTDNTKVILHLESELEKQNEIYKGLKELGHERITKLESELKEAVELIELYIEKSTHRENGMIYVNDFELFEKFNTFLTKHKSKE